MPRKEISKWSKSPNTPNDYGALSAIDYYELLSKKKKMQDDEIFASQLYKLRLYANQLGIQLDDISFFNRNYFQESECYEKIRRWCDQLKKESANRIHKSQQNKGEILTPERKGIKQAQEKSRWKSLSIIIGLVNIIEKNRQDGTEKQFDRFCFNVDENGDKREQAFKKEEKNWMAYLAQLMESYKPSPKVAKKELLKKIIEKKYKNSPNLASPLSTPMSSQKLRAIEKLKEKLTNSSYVSLKDISDTINNDENNDNAGPDDLEITSNDVNPRLEKNNTNADHMLIEEKYQPNQEMKIAEEPLYTQEGYLVRFNEKGQRYVDMAAPRLNFNVAKNIANNEQKPDQSALVGSMITSISGFAPPPPPPPPPPFVQDKKSLDLMPIKTIKLLISADRFEVKNTNTLAIRCIDGKKAENNDIFEVIYYDGAQRKALSIFIGSELDDTTRLTLKTEIEKGGELNKSSKEGSSSDIFNLITKAWQQKTKGENKEENTQKGKNGVMEAQGDLARQAQERANQRKNRAFESPTSKKKQQQSNNNKQTSSPTKRELLTKWMENKQEERKKESPQSNIKVTLRKTTTASKNTYLEQNTTVTMFPKLKPVAKVDKNTSIQNNENTTTDFRPTLRKTSNRK